MWFISYGLYDVKRWNFPSNWIRAFNSFGALARYILRRPKYPKHALYVILALYFSMIEAGIKLTCRVIN